MWNYARIFWISLAFLGYGILPAQELTQVSIHAGYNLYQIGRSFNNGNGFYSYNSGGKFGTGITYAFFNDRLKLDFNVLVFDEKINVVYWQNSIHGSGWMERLYKNDILQSQLLFVVGNDRNNFNFRSGLAFDVVMNTNYEEVKAFTGKSYIGTGEGDHFNYNALNFQIGGGVTIVQNLMLFFDFITAFKPKYITGESDNPVGEVYPGGVRMYKRYWTFTLIYSIPFSRKTRNNEIKEKGAYSNPLNHD